MYERDSHLRGAERILESEVDDKGSGGVVSWHFLRVLPSEHHVHVK